MKLLLWGVAGIIIGLLWGFVLFNLQILPKTEWTWSFGEPIEMQGELAAPVMLLDNNSDKVYYVIEYKALSDDDWELTKYYEFYYSESDKLPGLWEYKTNVINLKSVDFVYQIMPPYYPLTLDLMDD